MKSIYSTIKSSKNEKQTNYDEKHSPKTSNRCKSGKRQTVVSTNHKILFKIGLNSHFIWIMQYILSFACSIQ